MELVPLREVVPVLVRSVPVKVAVVVLDDSVLVVVLIFNILVESAARTESLAVSLVPESAIVPVEPSAVSVNVAVVALDVIVLVSVLILNMFVLSLESTLNLLARSVPLRIK